MEVTLSDRIVVLKNEIKEYAWGDRNFIPELMGVSSPGGNPQAEMWLGAHSGGPSQALFDDRQMPLDELIKTDPTGMLGGSVARRFSGRLPFLLKVLAAAQPLSIQAHPNREQALRGFEQEVLKGIPLDSPERNYKDRNHKPELICALTRMWALKGFRTKEEILKLTGRIGAPSIAAHTELLNNNEERAGLRQFFMSLINLERESSRLLVHEVMGKTNAMETTDPVIAWMKRLYRDYPEDIGVLSPLFLNVISLEPSEAIYISSGELHGYLEGAGLEIMANSDNVIRGGLTSKHVDTKELIDILDFSPGAPEIISPGPTENNETFYCTDNNEFILSAISLKDGDRETSIYHAPAKRSAEIIICTKGKARLEVIPGGGIIDIAKGMSVFVPASIEGYAIRGEGILYKAATPL